MKKILFILFMFCNPAFADPYDDIKDSDPKNVIRLVYGILNQTCAYPKENETWVLPKGIHAQHTTLFFDSSVQPSEMLKSFLYKQKSENKWIIDCYMAEQITAAFYALRIEGEANFNAKMSKFKKLTRATDFLQPKNFIMKPIVSVDREHIMGSIMNLPVFNKFFDGTKNAYGALNLVSCEKNGDGKRTFMGFDPEFFKEGPRTADEIYTLLAEHLCNDLLTDQGNLQWQILLRVIFENKHSTFMWMMEGHQKSDPQSSVSIDYFL